MNRLLQLKKLVIGSAAIFLFSLMISMNAYSQCSYCSASTDYQYEYIAQVVYGNINNSTSWTSGIADYTSKENTVYSGVGQTITVYLGNWYSADSVWVYIDWNQDCDFNDANETNYMSASGSMFYKTIVPPADAKAGKTRMRVRMIDLSSGPYSGTPCDAASYGDIEEYTLVVNPSPDAGVASIITPTTPYNEGTWPISMKLGSYGLVNLASCTVNWSVNGNVQTSYNWSGDLASGNQVQILLGNYNFIYPDGGPYNPFAVRVWLTNIVGKGTSMPDADATNNDRSMNTSPSTEDASAIAISQPSGSFIPGSVPIYVQIKNNARKPLTVVDVDWYVDGVKQGSKKWFGSLTQNQTAEVNVGNYNFYFKTPLAPFTIKAVTVNPNGVTDPISTNDQVSRDVAPSLVAGTYYIGGSTAHFPSMTSAVGYLNASGIIGNGDVILKINSGTYNEQVHLVTFPHGVNNFYFESASGNAADVNLNFAPNTSNNFIFGVSGVNNITFRNLTFNATDGGAGCAVAMDNSSNIAFSNVNFNGVYKGSNEYYSLVHLADVPKVSFIKCNFTNGYDGLHVVNYNGTNSLIVYNCKFLNNYNDGIDQEFTGGVGITEKKSNKNWIQGTYAVEITNNTFSCVGSANQGTIYISSPALIKNNKIDNFASTNQAWGAICLETPNYFAPSLIENNELTNLTGLTGILVIGNNVTINKNLIYTTGTASVPVAGIYMTGQNLYAYYNKMLVSSSTTNPSCGIYTSYASGVSANNLVNVPNGYGYYGELNNGYEAYYNTFAVNAANPYAGAYFYMGTNKFRRNIVANYGTGHSVTNNNSFVNSGENIFWTKGTSNTSDLSTWATITGDQTSSNVTMELTDDGLFKIAKYQDALLTYSPLGLSGTTETYDYYGNERAGFYYAGYAGIVLDIKVQTQPEALLACNGDVNKQLYVSAAMTYGAKAKYQWQRDGVDIPGATNPIYKFATFNYETAGTYRCRLYGPANTAAGLYSDEVLVYTLRPTEITRQPANTESKLGGTVFFDVEVHIKGIIAPYFQHKYQWWRHINGEEVQLMDNEYFANTTSPIMTITNLQDKHFNGISDYYYCVIEGQCGKVTTNPVKLNVIAGEILFDVQPASQALCLGKALTLNASATLAGGKDPLTYQWYHNNVALVDDAKINGSTTGTLTVSNVGPTDEGAYRCDVYSSEYDKTAKSDDANITVNMPPIINLQPKDQTIKEGENLTLSVEASGFEPISYQWYKDDQAINGANTADFQIVGATMSHNGFYYCKVINDCGEIKSTVVQVVVEKDGGIAGIKDGDAISLAVTPNPAVSDINVSFNLDTESQVEISIVDISGKHIASSTFNAVVGNNTVTMNLGNNISSGSYFVQILYRGTNFTRQIIVKK